MEIMNKLVTKIKNLKTKRDMNRAIYAYFDNKTPLELSKLIYKMQKEDKQ